jgi:uncharacterized protein (TIGR02145 family)
MKASNKGLLIPRVSLQATNLATPITSPAPYLLVFNTATNGSAPTNVSPGFYYWNAVTSGWVRLVDADDVKKECSLTGNADANVILGTKDGKDLVLKTQSADRLHITAAGSVGVNTTTPSSSALLELNSNSQGFLPPRMSAAQMTAIASPVEGLVVYNTTRNCLAYYDGTVFKCFSDRPAKVTKGSDFTAFYNGCIGSGPNYDNTTYGTHGSIVTHSTGDVYSANAQCRDAQISAGGCGGVSTVTGISGRVYRLVEINGQCWMAENLAEVPSNYRTYTTTSWKATTVGDKGYWGYYNSSTTGGSAGWGATEYVDALGRGRGGYLYQWSAAMNGATAERSRGACPAGFHIPSDCEFQYLEHGLGMTIAAENSINDDTDRDGSTTDPRIHRKMVIPTTDCTLCTNASGFSIVYAGYRRPGGDFTGTNDYDHWWISKEASAANAYVRKVNTGHVGIANFSISKAYAFGVRCLKD